ncbi:MAG TPA: NosD domain-containing protein [Candidatus Binatia bacterium]|jgi:hypothetical protein
MARRISGVVAAALVFGLAALAHGGMLHVAGNGVDGPSCGIGGPSPCGGKANPCRSITCAIRVAAAGDAIVVGPGVYGDLNQNGTLNETGEEGGEAYAPGCACVVAVNKPVSITSSDGAASTIIEARTVNVVQNVLVITEGGEFGKPGKGFTVTQTQQSTGDGIVIDSTNVKVRGNEVVGRETALLSAVGIDTVAAPETILIEANHVVGWGVGIRAQSTGKTLRANQVATNIHGIEAAAGLVVGNVATQNSEVGISLSGPVTATGNAAYGNGSEGGFRVLGSFTGTLEKNNIYGNGCGLENLGILGLSVAKNFWGAAIRPGPDPADDVCDLDGGTTSAPQPASKPFKVKAPIKL